MNVIENLSAAFHRVGMGLRTRSFYLLPSFFLCACYTSRQLGSAVPPNETRIAARLTEHASLGMAPLIGLNAVGVEGIVARTGANEWELQLLSVEQRNGQSVAWNRERVTFPAASLIAVRERKLHTGRTIAFAGGIAAAAILVAKAIGLSGILAGGDDGSPQPAN